MLCLASSAPLTPRPWRLVVWEPQPKLWLEAVPSSACHACLLRISAPA